MKVVIPKGGQSTHMEAKVQNNTSSHSTTIENRQRKQDKRRSPYAFLPTGWSRGAFLKWLRRTHAWLGFGSLTLAIFFVWRAI